MTVQDIAEAAGISRRTFFRYYSSKEHAAIQGQQRLLAAVESTDLRATDPSEVLSAIEDAAGGVITSKHDPTLTDHRRVARILAREASLRSFAAQQENELVAALSARLEPAELYESCRRTVRHIVPRPDAEKPQNDAGQPQN